MLQVDHKNIERALGRITLLSFDLPCQQISMECGVISRQMQILAIDSYLSEFAHIKIIGDAYYTQM